MNLKKKKKLPKCLIPIFDISLNVVYEESEIDHTITNMYLFLYC